MKKAYFFLIWTRVRISPDPLEGTILNFKFVPFLFALKPILTKDFTFFFKIVHDRFILANNGWKIFLVRGLDVFEKTEGRFNDSDMDQTRRKCKACEITYLKY